MSEQLPFPSDLAVLRAQLHYARERDRQAREMFATLAGLPADRTLEEMFHQIRRKMGVRS